MKKKEKKEWLVLLFVINQLILTACSYNQNEPASIATPQPFLTVTTVIAGSAANQLAVSPEPVKDWQQRWLKNTPCKSPCWEGITLGVTTKDDAIKLLVTNPLIKANSLTYDDDLKDTTIVEWRWLDDSVGGRMSYSKLTSQASISRIDVYYSEHYKLKDIFQAFGEPDYVFAIRDYAEKPPIFTIYFVYLKQGFLVYSDNNVTQKPKLSPDMTVRDPSFFAANTSIKDFGYYSATAQPWQGFKDFDFYCRDFIEPNGVCT